MSRLAFIRRRARMCARAQTFRARCAALEPLNTAETLVALVHVYHDCRGPLGPCIAEVDRHLEIGERTEFHMGNGMNFDTARAQARMEAPMGFTTQE